MEKHEIKTCPKCSGKFECKVGNIVKCQCSQVQLSDAETEFINSAYGDCLCINCLKTIKSEFSSIYVHEL